jgi:hypothetical protein
LEKLSEIGATLQTLREVREVCDLNQIYRGDHGVAKPRHATQCWAEVRIRGSSDFAPYFDGCKKSARQGFLTCRIHYDRELAARELKCEIEGVSMVEIAWNEQSRAEQKSRLAQLRARLRERRSTITGR